MSLRYFGVFILSS